MPQFNNYFQKNNFTAASVNIHCISRNINLNSFYSFNFKLILKLTDKEKILDV